MKLEHSLTPYTEINSKWIKDLNVRPDTIKLLEENLGRTLYDINHSKILFDPPPREIEIKTKINKWDLIELEMFCTAKENINMTRRQLSEWEKIFANEATDKGLISKIYKQLMQLSITKTNSKCIKDLNVRSGTVKPLEENIGRTLSDINCHKIFFDLSLRVMKIETKINKWDLIELKSFCTAKETINKMKRQPSE